MERIKAEIGSIIEKPFLILCEGKDAELFLIHYLNSEALQEEPRFSNDIQVFGFNGNDTLRKSLGVLLNTEGFEQVSRILVVRDAEKDPEAAGKSIQAAIKRCGLPVPEASNAWAESAESNIKTAYTLFPTCTADTTPGALEDLCWQILAEGNADTVKEGINEFIAGLKLKYGRSFPREFKARLHTYFSITDNYVSLKIGEAARAGAFDWNGAPLLPLRELIREGFSGAFQ